MRKKMSLIRKGTSRATAVANRMNAHKSNGPTSARGKDISRRNAVKHWGRAEVLRPMMPALGAVVGSRSSVAEVVRGSWFVDRGSWAHDGRFNDARSTIHGLRSTIHTGNRQPITGQQRVMIALLRPPQIGLGTEPPAGGYKNREKTSKTQKKILKKRLPKPLKPFRISTGLQKIAKKGLTKATRTAEGATMICSVKLFGYNLMSSDMRQSRRNEEISQSHFRPVSGCPLSVAGVSSKIVVRGPIMNGSTMHDPESTINDLRSTIYTDYRQPTTGNRQPITAMLAP